MKSFFFLLITSTSFNLLSDVIPLECNVSDSEWLIIINTDIKKVDTKVTIASSLSPPYTSEFTSKLVITPTKYMFADSQRWINRRNLNLEFYNEDKFLSFPCEVVELEIKI